MTGVRSSSWVRRALRTFLFPRSPPASTPSSLETLSHRLTSHHGTSNLDATPAYLGNSTPDPFVEPEPRGSPDPLAPSGTLPPRVQDSNPGSQASQRHVSLSDSANGCSCSRLPLFPEAQHIPPQGFPEAVNRITGSTGTVPSNRPFFKCRHPSPGCNGQPVLFWLYLSRMSEMRALRLLSTRAFGGPHPLLAPYLTLNVAPLRRIYSWAIPTTEALELVEEECGPSQHLLEIGAGTGFWAHLLLSRGVVSVTALDRRPMDGGTCAGVNGHHMLTVPGQGRDSAGQPMIPPAFTAVEEGGPEALELEQGGSKAHTLLMCWPPSEDDANTQGCPVPDTVRFMAQRSLDCFRGSTLLLVAEVPAAVLRAASTLAGEGTFTSEPEASRDRPEASGALPEASGAQKEVSGTFGHSVEHGGRIAELSTQTGGPRFFSNLLNEWVLDRQVAIPRWPAAHDSLTVWKRKRVTGSACVAPEGGGLSAGKAQPAVQGDSLGVGSEGNDLESADLETVDLDNARRGKVIQAFRSEWNKVLALYTLRRGAGRQEPKKQGVDSNQMSHEELSVVQEALGDWVLYAPLFQLLITLSALMDMRSHLRLHKS